MSDMSQIAGIGRSMNIADKYFRLFLRDALSPRGLNTAEGTVLLSMLEKSGGTAPEIFRSIHGRAAEENTQDELIERLQYDKGVMARTMKALEEKGFVERRANPADSRSSLFCLTDEGRELKGALIGALRRWSVVLLDGIPEQDLSVLERDLDRMAENAVRAYREQDVKHAGSAKEGTDHTW